MKASRPNFLILMADQLTARALPAYGNRTAITPHIDALAAAGVVFDSFYCNSPLCAPSRFSFLVGAPGIRHRRLRQCRGVPRAGAHFRTLSAPRRIPDGAERQDALLRRLISCMALKNA